MKRSRGRVFLSIDALKTGIREHDQSHETKAANVWIDWKAKVKCAPQSDLRLNLTISRYLTNSEIRVKKFTNGFYLFAFGSLINDAPLDAFGGNCPVVIILRDSITVVFPLPLLPRMSVRGLKKSKIWWKEGQLDLLKIVTENGTSFSSMLQYTKFLPVCRWAHSFLFLELTVSPQKTFWFPPLNGPAREFSQPKSISIWNSERQPNGRLAATMPRNGTGRDLSSGKPGPQAASDSESELLLRRRRARTWRNLTSLRLGANTNIRNSWRCNQSSYGCKGPVCWPGPVSHETVTFTVPASDSRAAVPPGAPGRTGPLPLPNKPGSLTRSTHWQAQPEAPPPVRAGPGPRSVALRVVLQLGRGQARPLVMSGIMIRVDCCGRHRALNGTLAARRPEDSDVSPSHLECSPRWWVFVF